MKYYVLLITLLALVGYVFRSDVVTVEDQLSKVKYINLAMINDVAEEYDDSLNLDELKRISDNVFKVRLNSRIQIGNYFVSECEVLDGLNQDNMIIKLLEPNCIRDNFYANLSVHSHLEYDEEYIVFVNEIDNVDGLFKYSTNKYSKYKLGKVKIKEFVYNPDIQIHYEQLNDIDILYYGNGNSFINTYRQIEKELMDRYVDYTRK